MTFTPEKTMARPLNAREEVRFGTQILSLGQAPEGNCPLATVSKATGNEVFG
jgi:hypothetical protein